MWARRSDLADTRSVPRPASSLLIFLLPSCAVLIEPEPAAPVGEYVQAMLRELRRGQLEAAERVLRRAQAGHPGNEALELWMVELDLMRGQRLTALDRLIKLSYREKLTAIERSELMGRIGEQLFALGRYGESIEYLRAGSSGPGGNQRRAKALLALAMPYARDEPEFGQVEIPLFQETWPKARMMLGRQEEPVVVDTGSSMTTLSQGLARELGVTDQASFGLVHDSLGGQHAAWIGILPSLDIGTVALRNVPVLIVEDSRLALQDAFGGPRHPPRAILGLDVLTRFLLTMDPVQGTLRLEESRPHRGSVVMAARFVDGCMVIPIKVDGVEMWFILDSAASHSSLTETGLHALPGGTRRAQPELRRPKSLSGRSYITRKATGVVMQTPELQFTNLELPVVRRLGQGLFPVHGVIGADLLRYCRVTMGAGGVRLERVRGARSSGPGR